MLFVDKPKPYRKSRRVSGPDDYETWVDDGQANTLNTFDMGDVRTTHAVVQPVQNPAVLLTMREGAAGGGKGPLLSVEQSLTLATGNGQTLFEPGDGYGVRRLTPIECERLQGFPDHWTEPAGSDSARYKALGNAVTVNTVQWVLGRIRNAMASDTDTARKEQ
jgi:DNA (cytosine-5)-methyltransferase 1